jgi:hypothetical protein
MLDAALNSYRLNLDYAHRLVADLSEDQLCAQPIEGRSMNHAAFVLGHLAWTSESMAGLLGAADARGAELRELFGMGSQVHADRNRYPSKVELVQSLDNAHARLIDAVNRATPEKLAEPAPERMRSRFATLGHLVFGLMTSHEGVHLGQLSAWRRAMGLPSV